MKKSEKINLKEEGVIKSRIAYFPPSNNRHLQLGWLLKAVYAPSASEITSEKLNKSINNKKQSI